MVVLCQIMFLTFINHEVYYLVAKLDFQCIIALDFTYPRSIGYFNQILWNLKLSAHFMLHFKCNLNHNCHPYVQHLWKIVTYYLVMSYLGYLKWKAKLDLLTYPVATSPEIWFISSLISPIFSM